MQPDLKSIPLSLMSKALRYDPETGKLFWLERGATLCASVAERKRWNSRYAGREAFTPNAHGYLNGFVLGRMYLAHRVAWAMHNKTSAFGILDHIDGDRTNNRISNLREVTPRENAQNAKAKPSNKSGVIGVSACRGRWRATIMQDGKQVSLGVFGTVDEAAAVRVIAERRVGYHPNHGRAA